ncbi:MAG: hypothetical protein LIO53_05560 [Oscillospiraceae bacterium]|nr:hypothetical protein [Oscillospiraceae bacterium]
MEIFTIMSKKNRRKTLQKKEGIIRKGTFSIDDSKMYIIATIIMFHILPLIFIIMGENGKMMLSMSYVTTNPIFLGITGLIYGIKKGFNFKFPLIMTVLSALSVFMYGEFSESMMIVSPIILGIVYLIFSFGATIIGAFIRRAFNFS